MEQKEIDAAIEESVKEDDNLEVIVDADPTKNPVVVGKEPEKEPEQEPEPVIEPDAEPGKKEEEKPVPSTEPVPEIDQLNNQLVETKKINNGLMQAKTTAMRKHQESSKAVEVLTNELNNMKSYIESLQNPQIDSSGPQKVDKTEVLFDDDGNAYIENLPDNPKLVNKIVELEQEIIKFNNSLSASKEETLQAESLSSFLNEKEGYKEAFPEVRDQWQYIKTDLFNQFVDANDINPPETKNQALEIMTSDGFKKAFSAKYPTADIDSVIQAGVHGGKYYERKALDAVLSKKTVSSHDPLPSDKPQSLSTVSGESDFGDEGFLERVSNMPFDEFLNLTPTEEARYNRLRRI